MSRRLLIILVVTAVAAGACSDLGVGEVACVSPGRGIGSSISNANILSAQAVPTARYTPCLEKLQVGWDSVRWSAEDGIAGIQIFAHGEFAEQGFLSAWVTKSCDVSDATRTESGYPDIEKYEDIQSHSDDIGITIIATGQRPLLQSQLLVNDLAGIEMDDRPVKFTIDDAIEDQVGPRVNIALLRDQYVWIVDELDAEEGTVELRSGDPRAAGRGLDPDDALELIEEVVPESFYRGNWYYTFDGGCIRYEFNAKGALAGTVAEDAEDALGFFPAWQLTEIPRDAA